MEILTSVKDTLLKALDDTPVCPTYNQESPPLDWGSTQTPTAWGQIDTKQLKTKAKGQEGKNPRGRGKAAKGYSRTFRCFRCNLKGHSAAECETDWAEIQRENQMRRSKLRLTKSQSRKRLIVIENH